MELVKPFKDLVIFHKLSLSISLALAVFLTSFSSLQASQDLKEEIKGQMGNFSKAKAQVDKAKAKTDEIKDEIEDTQKANLHETNSEIEKELEKAVNDRIKFFKGLLEESTSLFSSPTKAYENPDVQAYDAIIKELKKLNINIFHSLEDLEEKMFKIKETFILPMDD